jgi:hypothetical protein
VARLSSGARSAASVYELQWDWRTAKGWLLTVRSCNEERKQEHEERESVYQKNANTLLCAPRLNKGRSLHSVLSELPIRMRGKTSKNASKPGYTVDTINIVT